MTIPSNKIFIPILVILLVLPFAYAFFLPSGQIFLQPDEPTIGSALAMPGFWAWALPTYALNAVVILRSEDLTLGWRKAWLAITLVTFPISTWIFLGRHVWRGPSRVPRTLEEQRQLLRENVEKIKSEDRDT